MKFNSIEEVKRFIGGEAFDEVEYVRQHMKRLATVINNNMDTISAYTVDKYISNHLQHCIYPEFQLLLDAQKEHMRRRMQ